MGCDAGRWRGANANVEAIRTECSPPKWPRKWEPHHHETARRETRNIYIYYFVQNLNGRLSDALCRSFRRAGERGGTPVRNPYCHHLRQNIFVIIFIGWGYSLLFTPVISAGCLDRKKVGARVEKRCGWWWVRTGLHAFHYIIYECRFIVSDYVWVRERMEYRRHR